MREGARVGPYVLGALIAEGGMARVYEARSVHTDERVALKLPLQPTGGVSDEVFESLRLEVQAMARLSHPHVVPVLDWGADVDGQLYLAMPRVEDRSLRQVARHMDAAGLLDLVDQLLDALAYVHDRGVVHRDIKARNLLVAKAPGEPARLWLTDFGIASLDGSSLDGGGRAIDRGGQLGTPTYMSPEQLRGDAEVGPAADLYAVGVLLHLIFQGSRPYPGATPEEVLESRRRIGLPPFTADAIREVPEGLEPIVHRLLREDPFDRYPSASSLRKALSAVTERARRVRPEPPTGGVCLECGEPLPMSAVVCPICDLDAPTDVDLVLPSIAERDVLAMVLRVEAAHRPSIAAVLRRAGADVRWGTDGDGVAILERGPGAELAQAAELALSIAIMSRGQVGLAPAVAKVAGGVVRAVDDDAAHALAASALPGEVNLDPGLVDALGTSHHVLVRGGTALLAEPEEPAPVPDARLRPLLDLADSVARRRRAAAATLVADSGMGRSHALDAVASELREDGWLCLVASARARAQSEPFGVMRAALRDWAGVWPGANRGTVVGELGDRVGEDVAARVAGLLAEAAYADLEPEAIVDELGGLVGDLAARGPVLVAVDDLADADLATRRLLPVLLSRHRDHRVLVVATAAPHEPVLPASRVLELSPLPEAEARALLRTVCRASPEEEARMLALAEGRPTRLVELGRLYARSAEVAMAADGGPSVVARARFDGLGALEREVLGIAAIAGRTFWLGELLDVANDAVRERMGEVMRTLAEEELVERVRTTSVPGTSEHRFTRDAIYDVALASVGPERARSLHAACARWMERTAAHLGVGMVAAVAAHWDAAGEGRRAAAWDAVAGRRAEAMGALEIAVERYRSALARLGPVRASLDPMTGEPLPVDVPGTLAALAGVAVAVGELDVARGAADRALDVDEPPRALVRGRALAARAEVAVMERSPREAVALLDRALAELGDGGDRILRAKILGRRSFLLGYVLGRNAEGRACGEEALRLLDGLDVPAVESHVYSDLGAVELRAGEWDRQLECNRRALALAMEAGEISGQVRAHTNLGVCFTNRGKLRLAAEHAISAAALALRTGMHRARIIALNNLGSVRLDEGELDEARRLFDQVQDLAEQHGVRDVLHETLSLVGRARLAEGDLDAALACAEEARSLAEAEGNPVGVGYALRVEALVHEAAGRRADAIACLARAQTTLGIDGDAYERAVTALARASVQGSDDAAARATLTGLGADVALEARRWTVASPRR